MHCGKAVNPDRRLYCNNCGLPFRELAAGELLPPERPWAVAGPQRDALLSVLLIFMLPFAMGLLPLVGGFIGFDPSAPGADQRIELLKGVVLAGSFFVWFVAGAYFGWRAVRRTSALGWRVLGLIGLMGNLTIIILGALFAAGEVLSPH